MCLRSEAKGAREVYFKTPRAMFILFKDTKKHSKNETSDPSYSLAYALRKLCA